MKSNWRHSVYFINSLLEWNWEISELLIEPEIIIITVFRYVKNIDCCLRYHRGSWCQYNNYCYNITECRQSIIKSFRKSIMKLNKLNVFSLISFHDWINFRIDWLISAFITFILLIRHLPIHSFSLISFS